MIDPFATDGQHAAAIHRIPRIGDEVHKCSVELIDVDIDRQWPGAKIERDHGRRAQHGLQHLRDLLKMARRVENLALHRRAPREGQQLAGQLGCAICGVGNRVHVTPHPLGRQLASAQQIGR